MLAKAPNRKRAVEYLALSGAAAIWLTLSETNKVSTATPKPPNRALEYLTASGALPISIIEHDGVCSISTGGNATSHKLFTVPTR